MPASPEQEPAAPQDPLPDPAPATSPSPSNGEDQQPRAEHNASGEDGTVGTGTSIALGCIAGTLLLVVIGLIFLGIVVVLG